MHARIEIKPEKRLLGMRIAMSFSADDTPALWKRFMSGRNPVAGRVGRERYSAEVYPPRFFDRFDPDREFEKWAAVEIGREAGIPAGLDQLIVPAGLYAVFVHHGPASAAERTYREILLRWLPGSGYLLADRPHLAVMGESYRPDDPDAEEEIWIPVRNG